MFIIFIMWNNIKIWHNIATRGKMAYPISFHFHLESLTISTYSILEDQRWYALVIKYCYYKILFCKIMFELLKLTEKYIKQSNKCYLSHAEHFHKVFPLWYSLNRYLYCGFALHSLIVSMWLMESVIIYHNNLNSQCNFTAKAERLQDREQSPVTRNLC